MSKKVLVSALIFVFAALPILAQVQDGDWEFSPMFGMSYPGAELKRGWQGSFSTAYNFTTNWAGEAQLHYINTDLRQYDRDACGLRLSGIYNINPENSLVPYVKFGIGGRALSPDKFDDVFDEELLTHVGFGLKKFLSEKVAFKVEGVVGYCWNSDYINDYSWRLASTHPHNPNEPYFFGEEKFFTYELMMGLSFIGRKAPPPPPPSPTGT